MLTFYEAAVCPRMVAYVTNEHLNGFPSEEMNSSFSLILEVVTKALFLSAKMKKKPIDISWTSFYSLCAIKSSEITRTRKQFHHVANNR